MAIQECKNALHNAGRQRPRAQSMKADELDRRIGLLRKYLSDYADWRAFRREPTPDEAYRDLKKILLQGKDPG